MLIERLLTLTSFLYRLKLVRVNTGLDCSKVEVMNKCSGLLKNFEDAKLYEILNKYSAQPS